MKRWLLRVVAILGVLGVLGVLVAAVGLVPIAASSGHWAITESFLQFGKRRSIATHASSLDLPALDAPWLVAKGAGHYETGCRPCHGSPELQPPRIARAMLPPPPYLGSRVAEWKPAELFYIVKHGLKFTGMPAWSSQHRDDEVRAMVAFLLVLPTLDGAQYERLVHGDAPPANAVAPMTDLTGTPLPRAVIASCARCHGVDGLGRGSPAFPKLAGQKKDYLVAALEAYARDARHSGIMQPIAADLDPEQMRAVANYYARLPAGPPRPTETDAAAAVERGRAIATRGVPERRVPSCTDCHGPEAHPANGNYPVLAGQWQEYLVLQLELFEAGHRGGSPYAHLMDRVVRRLTPAEMRDVAAFYAGSSVR
jgi:cytochrome c553